MAKSEPEIKEKDSSFAYELSRKTFTRETEELFAKTIIVRLPKFKNPRLIAGIDGVGTKLLLANRFGAYQEVGYDAVAMGVNDVIRSGAQPIAFLPYIARDNFDKTVLKKIMEGIVRACQDSNCAIAGGETASMLGFYKMRGQHEISGCAIGIVEREKIITGEQIRVGDLILGLPSSGLHANGFSQVLKIFSEDELEKYKKLILTPTRIYVREILALLLKKIKVSGIAHITGGGMTKKIGAILPKGLSAIIRKNSFSKPKVFGLIEKSKKLTEAQAYNTFNMGIGMVLVLSKKEAEKGQKILATMGENAPIIGHIIKGRQEVVWRKNLK